MIYYLAYIIFFEINFKITFFDFLFVFMEKCTL